MNIMYALFCRSKVARKILIKYYSKKEGGVWRSATLRDFFYRYKGIKAGIGSYGWEYEDIKGPINIGNYCSLGPGIKRFEMNHITEGVTTHPCWFNPVYGWVNQDPRMKALLEIGNDVWIGANVILLPECKSIGDGAIIAAGAVVTKDVPPYEIWGGVPARCIRHRFSDEVINGLQRTQWWNFSEEKLKSMIDLFSDPSKFISEVDQENLRQDSC